MWSDDISEMRFLRSSVVSRFPHRRQQKTPSGFRLSLGCSKRSAYDLVNARQPSVILSEVKDLSYEGAAR